MRVVHLFGAAGGGGVHLEQDLDGGGIELGLGRTDGANQRRVGAGLRGDAIREGLPFGNDFGGTG